MEDIPADVALQIRQVGSWRLICASYRGLQHVDDGTPRQDAFALEYGDQAINMAVADGLGSAELSHVGAELACCRGVELLAREAPRDRRHFAKLYEGLHGEVREKASKLKTPTKELATTLQLLRIDGEGFWYGRLGDGACVLVDDRGVRWLGGVDRSPLGVSNLADQKTLSRLECDCVPANGVNGFLIFSDGVEEVFRADEENIGKMVKLVRDQNLEQVINIFNKFLSSDGGKDLRDDKTIIAGVLTRAPKDRRQRSPEPLSKPTRGGGNPQTGSRTAEPSGSSADRSAPLYNIIGQTGAGAYTWRVSPPKRSLLGKAILAGSLIAGIALATWFGIRASKQCIWLDPRPSCHQPNGPTPQWGYL